MSLERRSPLPPQSRANCSGNLSTTYLFGVQERARLLIDSVFVVSSYFVSDQTRNGDGNAKVGPAGFSSFFSNQLLWYNNGSFTFDARFLSLICVDLLSRT
eukprot:scaffold23186_cov63-Skeletonema_menzelii.AAC.2